MPNEPKSKKESGEFTFTLKTASLRSGVGVHSIRAWERRYGAIQPRRDTSGRRVFNEEQLERLINLGRLVRGGHRISTIAGYSTARLSALAARDSKAVFGGDPIHAGLVNKILAAAASSDERSCHRIITSAILMLDPLTSVSRVLSPLMVRVGEEWAAGRLSVAQEHMVTAILKRHMLSIMETLELVDAGPRIVIATLSGERHEIGAIFAAYLAICRGKSVTYLGPDIPAKDLAQIALDLNAVIVGVSLVHLPSETDVLAELKILAAERPSGSEIWLGGAALDRRCGNDLPPNCVVFETIDGYWERLASVV